MVMNLKANPFQLLRGTKTLALSNEKYNSFCKSSNNSMSTRFYKFNLQSTKIRRNNNYKLLTNKMNKISNAALSTQKRNNKFIRSQTQKLFKKNLLLEKHKKKKNIYFFVGENKFKHRNQSSFGIKNKIYGKNIGINLKEDFKQNLTSKNNEKKVKDFFVLLDSIFYDENYYYNKLKYKEEEIFGHKEEYYEYLKDELNYFINKEKDLTMKSEFYKIFKIKKYGKIDLYFKSARIEVLDIFDKLLLTIPLPFDLMNLLYLCDGSQINEFLVLLLQSINIRDMLFNSSNIFNLNDSTKKKIFSDILSKIKIEEGKLKFDIEKKNFERYYSQIKYLEKIKSFTDSNKYKLFLNEFFKDQDTIEIIDKSNFNNKIYNMPNFKNITKINFETNVNKYLYHLVSEHSIFKINLIFPEIILEFNSDKKTMNKYINKELMIFLYQNNFLNWDFYILHFLYSFKTLRRVLSGIFSAKNNNRYKRFSASNDYSDIWDNNKKEKEKEKEKLNIGNMLMLKNFNLNNTVSFDYKNFEYNFLLMDNVNLSLFILRSYTIYAFYASIKRPVIYEFKFNFQQMKILYIISLFEKLENFIYKLLYIKNGEINFNYSYFDHFLTMSNHNILNYFNDIYKLKEDNEDNLNQNKEKNHLNSINLRIVEPFIEVLTINQFQNNYKLTQSYIKLKNQFIEGLLKKEMKEWIYVIHKFKSDLNIKYQNKYEELRNKKVRKKISVFNNENKNRDLAKIFNKFLKIE